MRSLLICSIIAFSAHAETRTELNHYVKQFQVAARRYSKVHFRVGTLNLIKFITGGELIDEKHIATCTTDIIPTIEISQPRWNRADEWGKEAIIFHELGHCILGRLQHDDSVIVRNGKEIARTLMSTTIPEDTNDYLLNREYYQKELFEGAIAIPTLFFQEVSND